MGIATTTDDRRGVRAMPQSIRSTGSNKPDRPKKPRPDWPLFPHRNGQWANLRTEGFGEFRVQYLRFAAMWSTTARAPFWSPSGIHRRCDAIARADGMIGRFLEACSAYGTRERIRISMGLASTCWSLLYGTYVYFVSRPGRRERSRRPESIMMGPPAILLEVTACSISSTSSLLSRPLFT